MSVVLRPSGRGTLPTRMTWAPPAALEPVGSSASSAASVAGGQVGAVGEQHRRADRGGHEHRGQPARRASRARRRARRPAAGLRASAPGTRRGRRRRRRRSRRRRRRASCSWSRRPGSPRPSFAAVVGALDADLRLSASRPSVSRARTRRATQADSAARTSAVGPAPRGRFAPGAWPGRLRGGSVRTRHRPSARGPRDLPQRWEHMSGTEHSGSAEPRCSPTPGLQPHLRDVDVHLSSGGRTRARR